MNINQIKKLMERKKNSRKGENGHALIVGGSEDFVGAVVLAGLAAMRSGCDALTIASPEKVAWAVHQYSPDLITHKVKARSFTIKNAKEIVKFADQFDAVLVGTGLSRKADKFSEYFINKSQKLKVVDSDSLKPLSFKDFNNSIITPNEEELEMLLVNSKKEFLLPKIKKANSREKAEILQGNLRYFLQNNNVLLLKGSTDIIISQNKIAYNRTGNQGMTKTGTGDFLAGLIVGFLAKSKDLFKSAVAASFVNGNIGDVLLKKRKGYSFIASDLVDELAIVMKIDKKMRRSTLKASKTKKAVVKKPAKKKGAKK